MDFSKFTEKQCIEFLSQNYGLRGFNNSGITKEPINRTIENLRRECEIQNKLNV